MVQTQFLWFENTYFVIFLVLYFVIFWISLLFLFSLSATNLHYFQIAVILIGVPHFEQHLHTYT